MKMPNIFFLFCLISCCSETAEEKFKRECPYTISIPSANHFLKVPLTVVPNKLTYKLGDTITISTSFTDSIYDINTNHKFLIKNFPFDGSAVLWRFYGGLNWDAGFRNNIWKIDTINKPDYHSTGRSPDFIKVKQNYSDGKYNLEIKIIPTQKGKFIFQLIDQINEYDPGSEKWENILAINFEGKCPTFGFDVCNIIEGDNHLGNFETELVHIDKDIFYDNYATINDPNRLGVFGEGGFLWEWTGTYGFIVE